MHWPKLPKPPKRSIYERQNNSKIYDGSLFFFNRTISSGDKFLRTPKLSYNIKREELNSLIDYWFQKKHFLQWNCLFVIPVWLKVWWHHFGKELEPYILSVFHEEQLIGIAPLLIQGKTLRLMGDDNVCDYLDFVVRPEKAIEFYTFLLDYLKQEGFIQLELQTLRSDSSTFLNLIPLARELGYGVVSDSKDVSFEMDLPRSWETYLNALRGKERHEIRRKLRRLDEAGHVKYRSVDNTASIESKIDIFLTLFKSSRIDKAHFMGEKMGSFFRNLAIEMSANRIVNFFFLELDDNPVAAVMCFDYQSKRCLYNNGYDPRYKALSVGTISKVLSIKDSIQSGMKTFDFMKGSESYKERLGGKPIPLYQCVIDIH